MAGPPRWTVSTGSPESGLLLIADCVRSGREPGTLIRLGDGELQAFFQTKISPHQVGLSDVLATLALHGLSPARTVLIGAEPKSFALGLSQRLSLPRAARHRRCAGRGAYGGRTDPRATRRGLGIGELAMCIGIPMRVIESDGYTALCEVRGEQRRVNVMLIEGSRAGRLGADPCRKRRAPA